MYTEKTYRLGNDVIEVQRYSSGLFGAPGKSRQPRTKRSKEELKRRNKKNRSRYLQRLLLQNFKPGDLFIALEYDPNDRPQTMKEAKEQLRKFFERLRKYYKKRGYRCKYIGVTERGRKRGNIHHHIIVEAIDEDNLYTVPAIAACWPGSVAPPSVMYEEGNFEKLADYLVKVAEEDDPDETERQGASYMRSRNLEEPVAEKKTIHRRKWPKEPEAPEGWYVVKGSLVNGINQYTGKPYQRYFMRRIKNQTTQDIPKTPAARKELEKAAGKRENPVKAFMGGLIRRIRGK